jgi:hypothetical protein
MRDELASDLTSSYGETLRIGEANRNEAAICPVSGLKPENDVPVAATDEYRSADLHLPLVIKKQLRHSPQTWTMGHPHAKGQRSGLPIRSGPLDVFSISQHTCRALQFRQQSRHATYEKWALFALVFPLAD